MVCWGMRFSFVRPVQSNVYKATQLAESGVHWCTIDNNDSEDNDAKAVAVA